MRLAGKVLECRLAARNRGPGKLGTKCEAVTLLCFRETKDFGTENFSTISHFCANGSERHSSMGHFRAKVYAC